MNLNHPFLSMLLGSINYTYNSCLFNLFLHTSALQRLYNFPKQFITGLCFPDCYKVLLCNSPGFWQEQMKLTALFPIYGRGRKEIISFFCKSFWILLIMYTIILLSNTVGLLFDQSFLDFWSFFFSPTRVSICTNMLIMQKFIPVVVT